MGHQLHVYSFNTLRDAHFLVSLAELYDNYVGHTCHKWRRGIKHYGGVQWRVINSLLCSHFH